MRKIIISAGHGGTDPGASGNGYIERDLAIELRNLIVSELKALGISALVDDDKNALKQTLLWLRGKFTTGDILIDMHWNAAGNPDANGSEVIIPQIASSFEKDLAAAILKCFTSFGFRDRGVKPETETARKSLGWMRPNAENVLIEVCFISNLTDMKLYQANKQGIARRVAATLAHFRSKN
jgi:N-acetylmuramoyl-L-alanine amidase